MDLDPWPVTDPEVLFRYLVVSRVLAEVEAGQKVSRIVGKMAREVHLDFARDRRVVKVRTLYRWLAAYRERGLKGLAPEARESGKASVVLPADLLLFAKQEKEADPRASVPEILKRARQLGVVKPGKPVDRTTLYRALGRMGVATRRAKTPSDRDTRRFAWPDRMQMVLADGKHFRAGDRRLRRVALFLLDNATRMGLDVVVGTSEDTVLFLTGLYGVLRRHGRMDILFLDGGPGFISKDTVAVVAKLEVHLIHGEAAYPQGHGEIERFNQTAKDQVLRHLDGRADVDPDPGALTVRLRHWLFTGYNRTPHEFLDGATPEGRFLADERPLRLPADEEELASRFVLTEERKVSKDHVVPFAGVDYEVPTGQADRRITIWRRVLTGRLYVPDRGRLVEIFPVDLAENARSRRARREKEEPPARPTRGAADLAFRHDFGPIVTGDGGFPGGGEKENDE